jgi:lactate dehydrogenase-like 2-hydroxyacid dehydrogenase
VNSKGIKLILDFEADNKLSELAKTNKNIVYTPNIAWRSEKSIFNLHQIALDNLKAYVNDKPQNKVK